MFLQLIFSFVTFSYIRNYEEIIVFFQKKVYKLDKKLVSKYHKNRFYQEHFGSLKVLANKLMFLN